MYQKLVKLFLRLALSSAFLSAVADRFGFWPGNVSAWGNWDAFVHYVGVLNSWAPHSVIPALAIIATAAEVLFAVCLLFGIKTRLFAILSGVLLLIFALSMTFSTGIKTAFDASVYTASAGAFALSLMKGKFLELDCLMKRNKRPFAD